MAKKPNYNFEKRQKDLARQKKKEEKLQKKALRKAGGAEGEDDTEAVAGTELETDGAVEDAPLPE